MVEEQSPDSIICPKCSTDNKSNSKFCRECGTPLTGSEPSNRKPVTPHKKEDPVESLKESGKEIMEGIGGFIDKATAGLEGERKAHETAPGDDLSINGMITEERAGFSGQTSADMQQATATLEDDKMVITKRSMFGESDRGEKHIRYEDISTVDLDRRGILTPGAIQIYTHSGQFSIRKNKAHKLEPFFKKLSQKVDNAKKKIHQPMVSEQSAADELRKFAELRDDGIITEEEFEAKKKEIMNR